MKCCVSSTGHFVSLIFVCVCAKPLSCVQLFAAHQAPQFMVFPRREYWSLFPRSPPGDLPNTGIEPAFPELQTDSLLTELLGKSP